MTLRDELNQNRAVLVDADQSLERIEGQLADHASAAEIGIARHFVRSALGRLDDVLAGSTQARAAEPQP